MKRKIALTQGLFYVASGVWPLVNIRSFEAVTGPKRERWLVKTVGVLVAVIGGVMTAAAARRNVTPEIAALGAGSAAGLAAIDITYATRGRIAPVYLADAALELAVAGCWTAASLGAGYLPYCSKKWATVMMPL